MGVARARSARLEAGSGCSSGLHTCSGAASWFQFQFPWGARRPSLDQTHVSAGRVTCVLLNSGHVGAGLRRDTPHELQIVAVPSQLPALVVAVKDTWHDMW